MHRRRGSLRSMFWLLLLFTSVLVNAFADRIRGENGTLSLRVAVPLTKDNQTVLDPGWFHLAAALLAADHFNARNCSIVPELCTPLARDCGMTMGQVTAVDTGTHSHQAMEYVVQELLEARKVVDAIAGPYNDIPALELSVLATGLKAPMVAHRALDSNLLDPKRHPFFSQISADFVSEMQFVAHYLNHVGRTNYVAILYASSSASGLQKVDLLRTILAKEGFDQVRTFSYKARGDDELVDMSVAPDRSVQDALENIQQTGYRTIYVLPQRLDTDTPEIGRVATALGLNNGHHLWVLGGGAEQMTSMEVGQFAADAAQQNTTILKGAAYLYPVDDKAPLNFPETSLEMQSNKFFHRVQRLLPNHITLGEREQEIASAMNPIQRIAQYVDSWMHGTSYMYDAVIAIGMGACQALDRRPAANSTALTGKMHLEGIRATQFEGASGMVRFGGNPKSPGSRDSNTIFFGVVNLLPHGNETPHFVRTETLDPQTGEWSVHNELFVYADGTTSPPTPLRDPPEMNHLNPAYRAVGLTLMTIALVFVFLSTLWIYFHRNHSVVIAAQPEMLYSLCLGSAMLAFAILMLSYDESYGVDEAKLSRMCVANVWLDVLGHIIAFGALFTKLWRVNRCMRYKTNNIEIWRVMWPCVFFIVVSVALLSVMTHRSVLGWERRVLDATTGESIGGCNADEAWAFMVPVYVLHFVPTILTGIMAWKTLGMDDLYSESKWVLAFILVQVQVLIVAAPVVALLQNESANARFVSYSLLMFTFPLSAMGLIILPKAVKVRRMKRNADKPPETPQRPAESAPTREASDDINILASNNSAPTVLVSEGERRKPRSSHGPRIQVVTFD